MISNGFDCPAWDSGRCYYNDDKTAPNWGYPSCCWIRLRTYLDTYKLRQKLEETVADGANLWNAGTCDDVLEIATCDKSGYTQCQPVLTLAGDLFGHKTCAGGCPDPFKSLCKVCIYFCQHFEVCMCVRICRKTAVHWQPAKTLCPLYGCMHVVLVCTVRLRLFVRLQRLDLCPCSCATSHVELSAVILKLR